MIKLGVITDEISQDFEEAAQLAVKYGLHGLEVRSVWEKAPHELDDADIERIKAILKKYNLECCAISAPFFKCGVDSAEEYAQQLDILKRCIKLAKCLGTQYIRGFTFWSCGKFSDYLPLIIEKFKTPVEILNKEQMTLLIEFDPSVFASDCEKVAAVVKGVNSDRVWALWDPGNDIHSPENEIPYPDGYEYIKDYIKHIHIKDAVKEKDGTATGVPFGAGLVDYRSIFKRLKADGYEGYMVMETHYRPKHAISEELMALPKGSAFSMYGKEATEECLINFKQLFAECMG